MTEGWYESHEFMERGLPPDPRYTAGVLLGWAEVHIPKPREGDALEYTGRRRVAEAADDPDAPSPGEVVDSAPYHCRVEFLPDGTLLVMAGYERQDIYLGIVPSDPTAPHEKWRYTPDAVLQLVSNDPVVVNHWAADQLKGLSSMRSDPHLVEAMTGVPGRSFFHWEPAVSVG